MGMKLISVRMGVEKLAADGVSTGNFDCVMARPLSFSARYSLKNNHQKGSQICFVRNKALQGWQTFAGLRSKL